MSGEQHFGAYKDISANAAHVFLDIGQLVLQLEIGHFELANGALVLLIDPIHVKLLYHDEAFNVAQLLLQ